MKQAGWIWGEAGRQRKLRQPRVFLSHLQSTVNCCQVVMLAHCCHTFWIFKRGWKFRFFNLLYKLSKTDLRTPSSLQTPSLCFLLHAYPSPSHEGKWQETILYSYAYLILHKDSNSLRAGQQATFKEHKIKKPKEWTKKAIYLLNIWKVKTCDFK